MDKQYNSVLALADNVLQEIEEAGYSGSFLEEVTKILVKLDGTGVTYVITYLKDLVQYEESTCELKAESSKFIENLKIENEKFSKDGMFRMGLCEVLIELEADKIPMVTLKYEILAEGD